MYQLDYGGEQQPYIGTETFDKNIMWWLTLCLFICNIYQQIWKISLNRTVLWIRTLMISGMLLGLPDQDPLLFLRIRILLSTSQNAGMPTPDWRSWLSMPDSVFFHIPAFTYAFSTSYSTKDNSSSLLWTQRVFLFTITCIMDVQALPFQPHMERAGCTI
jgi:hypothetical protein